MPSQENTSNPNELSNSEKTIVEKEKEKDLPPGRRALASARKVFGRESKWLNKPDRLDVVSLILLNEGRMDTTVGQALMKRGKWSLALRFLKGLKAHEEHGSPEEQDTIERMIEECRESLRFPQFKAPFKDRVEDAWTDFEISLPELQKALEDAEPDPKGKKWVDIFNVFNQALSDEPLCRILLEDDKTKIQVVPDSLTNCFEWQYIKQQAPDEISKDWPIEILRSPSTDKYLGIYLKGKGGQCVRPDFDIDTITLALENQKDLFTAFSYCADWQPFLNYPDDFESEYDVIDDVLERYLGSVTYYKYLLRVLVLTVPPPESAGPAITPTELPQFFSEKGIDIYASAETLLNSTVTYKLEREVAPEDWRPRDDIISGKTMCQKLIRCYFERETDEVDRFEADGVAAGSLYYSIDSFQGENGLKAREEFMGSLKKELLEKAGEDSVKIVGDAHGEKYDYVDIFAWDSKKVLKVVKNFFKRAPVSMSAFQSFKESTSSYIFTDKNAKGAKAEKEIK